MGSASERTLDPSLERPGQRGLGLPKRERLGAGSVSTDQCSFPRNPVDSTTLPLRKTRIRNGVTIPRFCVGHDTAGVNRIPRAGRIAEEAKAGGKAAG